MFSLKNIVSPFEPYTCQDTFQHFNISNQTGEAEAVAEELIGSSKVRRFTNVQVDPASLKPLKPT